MDMKRLLSSRQSLPLLLGTIALAIVTYVLTRAGNQAVDDVTQQQSSKSGTMDRELVTIRVGSKWKLKKASWGSVEPPEQPLPAPEEEPDPAEKAFAGLDIAVQRK